MYAHDVLTITQAMAEVIREAKDKSGMTFEEIATASGLSTITVKRIMGAGGPVRPLTTPNVEQLASLGSVLDADPGKWLIEAERRVEASHRHGRHPK